MQMIGVFSGFGLRLHKDKHFYEFYNQASCKSAKIIFLSNVLAFAKGSVIALGLCLWLELNIK